MENKKAAGGIYNSRVVFILLWVILFILYYPTAKAGRVGDFPGWVTYLRTTSFWDYVYTSGSHLPSFYQFTQLTTYFFYSLFGTEPWPWHLLFISMQAVNGCLLFTLVRNLCTDAGIKSGNIIALAGTLLLCICPHISEVVVWEPAYHYLQGLLFILAILLCAQRFINTGLVKHALTGCVLFFLSTFSLEFFYLTPFFVSTLFIFYRIGLNYDKSLFKRSLYYFAIPVFILFGVHLVFINVIFHTGVAHIGSETVTFTINNLSKPLKYIFHMVFFGRCFNDEIRNKVYAFCQSTTGLILFYIVLAAWLGIIALYFKKMSPKGKVLSLLFIWSLFSVALICPMWFPDMFLVLYDRYAYVLNAFSYFIFTLLISYISMTVIGVATWSLYALANCFITYKINKLWKASGDIVNTLIATFPNDTSKVVLIMNVPQCYRGIQMMDAREEGHFKLMYNAVMPKPIKNTVFEVSSPNISSPDDGAHVTVINDTLLRITLNQWGTWWYWAGLGSGNYENEYYKKNMVDQGHWYELVLKKPAAQYKLLYIVGDKWKEVDMNKKNIDQY